MYISDKVPVEFGTGFLWKLSSLTISPSPINNIITISGIFWSGYIYIHFSRILQPSPLITYLEVTFKGVGAVVWYGVQGKSEWVVEHE